MRHMLNGVAVLGLLCSLPACQDRSWEQYMEAAAFAFQDGHNEEAEAWFLAADRVAARFEPTDPRLALTLGNLADFYHARARDDEASIQRRLGEARKEIELGQNSGAYDAHVVNGDLDTAIDEVCRLIRERLGAGGA